MGTDLQSSFLMPPFWVSVNCLLLFLSSSINKPNTRMVAERGRWRAKARKLKGPEPERRPRGRRAVGEGAGGLDALPGATGPLQQCVARKVRGAGRGAAGV